MLGRLVHVKELSPFVGRQHELDLLRTALDGNDAVLLLGDAGVGKSRLTSELVRLLTQRGRRCLSASCLPMATRLPLLPIVNLLRECFTVDGGRPFEAALQVCPAYVREDLARILPEMGGSGSPRLAKRWILSRLFAAVVQFWSALADAAPLLLVVEDLHWGDQATRDFLTYLLASRRSHGGAALLLTARTDEPRLDDRDNWLQQTAMSGTVSRMLLAPLSSEEISELATAVRGEATASLVEELWLRAEGNAFFTEQLLAAGATGSGVVLPSELAELLRARVAATSDDERRVIELLAVAGRPVRQNELALVCGLPDATVQASLRGLARAQLIRLDHGGIETRHALLGEAIVDGLLPAERASLDVLVATLLRDRRDPSLAAEAARHWERAGRLDEERDARIAAAEQAERMGALAEAGRAWQRAYELAEATTQRTAQAFEPSGIALRGIAALEAAGDSRQAEALAARALTHTDHSPSSRAALQARYALLRAERDRARGVRELDDAIRALEAVGPSAELVESRHRLYSLELGLAHGERAFQHLQLAVSTGEALPPSGAYTRALASLAYERMRAGDLEAGQTALDRARELTPSQDPISHAALAHLEVYVLLQRSRLPEAEQAGRAALAQVATHGLLASYPGTMLAINVVWALVAAGRVTAAGELIDPMTDEPVTVDGRVRQAFRSWVDLHRGRLDDAAERQAAIQDLSVDPGAESATEFARMRAELAFWNGDPGTAAHIVEEALAWLPGSEEPLATANLLVTGMQATAELAEVATARHDHTAQTAAQTTATALETAAERSGPEIFHEHPFFATMAPLAAQWRAERARTQQLDTDQDWTAVQQRWQRLGWPHRAAYASWRRVHVAMREGDRTRASEALRAAWSLADEHVPLRGQISSLARLARIPLPLEDEPDAEVAETQPPTATSPWGLTSREMDVLRLITQGLTNAQIGARLYMSPKTASVHVTAILRKLQATNRVHAAAIAERAGLV